MRFGDYELLEEVARGGMGIVYRARQLSLNRTVAVKMIRAGPIASKEFVHRFRTEAATAAVLQHPNIVAVHEVGVHEGEHFFSMDFVAGSDLEQMARQGPLSAERAARYVRKIAEAVHYAHQQGILHRDLKPSNVLIDQQDQPRVTDFGLAKQLGAESGVTLTGEVLGTPGYLPPEQASGKRGAVGVWSDVYSLGAILYSLLTGRAPFVAESFEETLNQVLYHEPAPPRLLISTVPGDLETICLKCLEKEPARRYQTALELSDELGRVLNREPILARPVSITGKIWRWCQRKPALAGLIVALHVVAAASLGAVLWQWARARENASARLQALDETRRLLYAADIRGAHQAWEMQNTAQARDLLGAHRPEPGQEDLRGFEWRLLWRMLHDDQRLVFYPHPGDLRAVAVAPDGRSFVSLSGIPHITIAEAPDGQQESSGTARVWGFDGKRPSDAYAELPGISCIAYSPVDGMLALETGFGEILFWDGATQRKIAVLETDSGAVTDLAFSPDGAMLASAGSDPDVRLWAVSGRRPAGRLHTAEFTRDLRFSPRGKILAAATGRNEVQLWNLESRTLEWEFEAPVDGRVRLLNFSANGSTLAMCGDDTVLWWDVVERQFSSSFDRSRQSFEADALSSDGLKLATGSWSGWRIWDLETKRELYLSKRRENIVTAVAFFPQADLLAAGVPGGVWVHRLRPEPPYVELRGSRRVFAMGFSADCKTLASHNPALELWNAASGQKVQTSPEMEGAVAFSHDGRCFAKSLPRGDTLEVRDSSTFEVVAKLSPGASASRQILFSPHGKLLAGLEASENEQQVIRVWNVALARQVLPLIPIDPARAMSFSRDENALAVGTMAGTVIVWDTRTGKEITRHYEHRDPESIGRSFIHGCVFLADNRTLATGDNQGRIVLWDIERQRKVQSWQAHPSGIRAMALSGDGQTLVSSAYDRMVTFWHTPTWRAMLSLEHPETVYVLAFSPDGQILAAGCGNGVIGLWRAASWQEIDAVE